MSGIPESPPILTNSPSTKGTPGLFQGKSWRVGKAQEKENTQKISDLLAQRKELTGEAEANQKEGLLQIQVVGEDAKKRIDEIDKEIEELQKQGGDLKKAQKQSIAIEDISEREIRKGLSGPEG